MEIRWRPYQEDCLKVVQEKLFKQDVKRQLVVAATGTGKRLLAVGMSTWFKRKLFLCHREELIEQAFADFSQMYNGSVGIIKGPRFEINHPIVIASIQTIHRRLDKIPEDYFDLILVDEVHHYLAPTYIKPLDYFKTKLIVGFTATPYRLDGLDFSNIMDEIVFDYPIDKAVRDGYLCQLEAYRTKTGLDLSGVRKLAGDFINKDLSLTVNIEERNQLIVNKYIEWALQRLTIAFCVDIEHALDLAEMFNANGIPAVSIHSRLDQHERAKRLMAFKTEKIKVITNVEILTEGYDHDDVGCIIQARPTQSLALYMQMIGRGTRLKSNDFRTHFGANNCIILDIVDNTSQHSLINTWTIDTKKGTTAKDIDNYLFMDERRKKMFKEHLAQRRIIEIKRLKTTGKKVELLPLTDIKVYHRGRMLEPATAKQLDWLKQGGIWQPGVEYTKAQASEYISSLPAQPWQVKILKEWGYLIIEEDKVTNGQYYKAKQKMEKAYKSTN